MRKKNSCVDRFRFGTVANWCIWDATFVVIYTPFYFSTYASEIENWKMKDCIKRGCLLGLVSQQRSFSLFQMHVRNIIFCTCLFDYSSKKELSIQIWCVALQVCYNAIDQRCFSAIWHDNDLGWYNHGKHLYY